MRSHDPTTTTDRLTLDVAAARAELEHNYQTARANLGLDRPADYTLPTEEPTP